MKIIIYFFFILSLFAFNSPSSNKFVLEETTYSTKHGYLESYGKDETGLIENYDVHLVSAPLETHTEDLNYILLDINTLSNGKLEAGIYNYEEPTSKKRENFTFNSASVLINYNLKTYTGQVYSSIDGTIEVQPQKDQYLIKYDLLLENGKEVIGTFFGKLEDWDQGM